MLGADLLGLAEKEKQNRSFNGAELVGALTSQNYQNFDLITWIIKFFKITINMDRHETSVTIKALEDLKSHKCSLYWNFLKTETEMFCSLISQNQTSRPHFGHQFVGSGKVANIKTSSSNWTQNKSFVSFKNLSYQVGRIYTESFLIVCVWNFQPIQSVHWCCKLPWTLNATFVKFQQL